MPITSSGQIALIADIEAEFVSEMIDAEPERANEARSQLAYLYFMSAEFAKAKPHFQVNPKRMRGLAKVNESLAGSFDPDEHQTSAIQLADIIKRVESMNRIALAGKILSFDYASLGYREGYELAVAAMFGDHAGCFSYEAETQTLTINGGGKSLPDQLNKVQAQIQGEQLADSFSDRARKELSWLEGEDNDLRKQFEATVGDERFKKLKTVIKREAPEVAAQLDYWFAHATNSIYGRKPVESKKTSPVLNPSKTGTPSSAKPEKTSTRTAKAIKELEARFRESGSARDFAELRKFKMGR